VSTKKLLTADEILQAEDIITMEVDVPEWGGSVKLRSLSGADAMRFIEAVGKKAGSAVDIVALCAVDDAGNPLFTEEQWDKLKTKSLRAILRLQRAALEINGLTEESAAQAKNV
jgi:hypothetical protein